MKASDLLVKALEHEGVEYVFGIPGEENLDFLDSLKNSSIKLIVTRHEQAAGFMAATYGRLTGKAGVCMSTLGPGATNFATSAAYAQLGGMPVVMITGQKPIHQSKQGQFQIVDVVKMFEPVTKFSKQIVNGNLIPSLVREAFRVAEDERPGAVLLELPEDVAEETCLLDQLFPTTKIDHPSPSKVSIAKAVTEIEDAKHPLILIGSGANRKNAISAIHDFIRKTKIPFFNTQMGKGIASDVHNQYIGTAALSAEDFVHDSIKKADLIINIGHDVIEKPPFFMEHGGAKVIHINFFPAQVDNVYFPQQQVVGYISRALKNMTALIEPQESWDFSVYKENQKKLQADILNKSDAENFPMLPQRIVADVRKSMPKDGVVCLDNGMYKIWFARNYRCFAHNTLLLDNALATMGAGLPSAMATALIHPEKKVLAVTGDGGFMMNSQEIETSVRLKLNVTVLIINDSAYGMIKWKQETAGFDDFGLDLGNPDFVKYAESYGAKGYKVKKASDLSEILDKCIAQGGVNIIECPVDYMDSKKFGANDEDTPQI